MSTYIVKDLLRNYYNVDDTSRLDLDRAIKYLVETNTISDEERIVLKLTIEQTDTRDIARTVNLGVTTTKRRLDSVSAKMADYLGVEYQDIKILKEVEDKLGRKLTPEEEQFCWGIIRRGRGIRGVSIFSFRIENGRISAED